MSLTQAQQALYALANKEQAQKTLRFFKTGKGEYGEGDVFLGLRMPQIHALVKQYRFTLTLDEIEVLLHSKYHEARMFALLLLGAHYKSKRNAQQHQAIYALYLKNTAFINNWDLVDISAPHIVGYHLLNEENREVLYTMAHSKLLWERRIAIISTFAFINQHDFEDALKLADILLHDTEDLIHKAVGWTIRNVGNKNLAVELDFLRLRYKTMPRTMLRYAIEKFDEPLRQKFLKGTY